MYIYDPYTDSFVFKYNPPPIIPIVKTYGRWVKGTGENGVTTSLFCSKCNYENKYWEKWNYCPNCGERKVLE